jgi:hypothetical protein
MKYKRLTKEIDSLEFEKQKSRDLGNQVRVLTKVSDKYKEEIKNLQKEKTRLETLVKIFENSSEYKKIRQTAEEEVTYSLSKRKDLLKLAVSCVIEAILRDPVNFNLLINSSQYGDGQQKASQAFIDLCRVLVLNEAQKLFEVMARELTNNVIKGATLTISHQP